MFQRLHPLLISADRTYRISKMAEGQGPSQEVMMKYRQLTQECQQLMTKVAELEMDRNEHRLVEDTLEPLDPDRTAYRLVGEVLVERSVKEVLPSVKSNRENLESTIKTLRERLSDKQRETAEFKAEYKLQ